MKTYVVASIKGGVGKTTVSVNLARAMKRAGQRVGLLDLDYRNPECPLMMEPAEGLDRTSGDAIIPAVAEGIALFSMAFLFPDGKAVMVEDDLATTDVKQLLTPGIIAWPELDVLIIDSPPNSAGINIVAMNTPGIGAIAVSHPSSASLAALHRTLDLFAEKQVPAYGIIANQGADADGRYRYDLHDDDLRDLADARGLPVFIAIPHAPANELEPYFDTLAQKLLNATPIILKTLKLEGGKWSQLSGLLKRLG